MRDTILWRLCAQECAWIDCDTKYEWISDIENSEMQTIIENWNRFIEEGKFQDIKRKWWNFQNQFRDRGYFGIKYSDNQKVPDSEFKIKYPEQNAIIEKLRLPQLLEKYYTENHQRSVAESEKRIAELSKIKFKDDPIMGKGVERMEYAVESATEDLQREEEMFKKIMDRHKQLVSDGEGLRLLYTAETSIPKYVTPKEARILLQKIDQFGSAGANVPLPEELSAEIKKFLGI